MDGWTIVGTIASIAGFGLSWYVLVVAQDARTAAREARVLAAKRTLAEELDQAKKYTEEVGTFLQNRQWTAVRIRAQEVMTSCRQTLTRWPHSLSEQRRDDVLTASTLIRSIAELAADPTTNNFSNAKLRQMSTTQLEAAGLITNALGEARNHVEQDGN